MSGPAPWARVLRAAELLGQAREAMCPRRVSLLPADWKEFSRLLGRELTPEERYGLDDAYEAAWPPS